jgi:hypothetical protein
MTAAFMNYDAAQTPPELGNPTATFTLACDDDAPSAARKAVYDLCRGRSGGCIADAGLVVSELVTNAVVHTRGDEIVVSLWRGRTTIDGHVCDGGSGFIPRARASSDIRVGGHGLEVVDLLVESWGSRRVPSSVWFRSAMSGAAKLRLDLEAHHVPARNTHHALGREAVKAPAALEIVESDTGYSLRYIDERGEQTSDRWHASLQDAKLQAECEFSVRPDEWPAAGFTETS